jgi:hypothetical protein
MGACPRVASDWLTEAISVRSSVEGTWLRFRNAATIWATCSFIWLAPRPGFGEAYLSQVSTAILGRGSTKRRLFAVRINSPIEAVRAAVVAEPPRGDQQGHRVVNAPARRKRPRMYPVRFPSVASYTRKTQTACRPHRPLVLQGTRLQIACWQTSTFPVSHRQEF